MVQKKKHKKKSSKVTKKVSKKVSFVPKGLTTVTASLVLKDCSRAIEFYKSAFGAKELSRMPGPDGRTVMHAELKIGDSVVYLSDEMPEGPAKAPTTAHQPTASMHMYVKDCDAVFERAVQNGAKITMPMADMFWGDRFGQLVDPFGQLWSIATHTRDVSDKEMKRAAQEFMASMPPPQTPSTTSYHMSHNN